ncbi:unnamed protein product [Adineta ricciae]|uniref:Uncharacterized protein n=1 Tax=Adineta ricciae TaxID=249248 RepID=A0A814VE76_ADIRI|nr:unnamed protein product [Adineta ricciae]CAF1567257.1 unnamed protein product [Adineta ricciae]
MAQFPSRCHLRNNPTSATVRRHEIITYGPSRHRRKKPDNNNDSHPVTSSSVSSSTTTATAPFPASLQATASKELQKFTGDPSQKITHFINAIELLRSFIPLSDAMLHSIASLVLLCFLLSLPHSIYACVLL